VAYLGKKVAQPILIEGLKRLEYRGYDSAGLALLGAGAIRVKKTSGRISALEQILDPPDKKENLGLGHTRWATHGEPNTVNAHPHLDSTGKIAVVHNGIIENYATLKTWLQNEGINFVSETDTEVISNLIGYFYAKGDGPHDGQNKFEWAVQRALHELHGTFGLAIACSDFPGMLIGARKGSPLILGVGDDEYILASDAAAPLIMSPSPKTCSKSNFRWTRLSWAVFRTICLKKSLSSPRPWVPVWAADLTPGTKESGWAA
jgi:glucosamine--fructose-6-phosphate aminotransferase (isomerizing)